MRRIERLGKELLPLGISRSHPANQRRPLRLPGPVRAIGPCLLPRQALHFHSALHNTILNGRPEGITGARYISRVDLPCRSVLPGPAEIGGLFPGGFGSDVAVNVARTAGVGIFLSRDFGDCGHSMGQDRGRMSPTDRPCVSRRTVSPSPKPRDEPNLNLCPNDFSLQAIPGAALPTSPAH